jgi:hypothetical protein
VQHYVGPSDINNLISPQRHGPINGFLAKTGLDLTLE